MSGEYIFFTTFVIQILINSYKAQDISTLTKKIIDQNANIPKAIFEGDIIKFNFTLNDPYSSSVGCYLDHRRIIKFLGQMNLLTPDYSNVIEASFNDNLLQFSVKLMANNKNLSCIVYDNNNPLDPVGDTSVNFNIFKSPLLKVPDYVIYQIGNTTIFTCNCTGNLCKTPTWYNLPNNGRQKAKMIGTNPIVYVAEASTTITSRFHEEYLLICSVDIGDRTFNVTTVLRDTLIYSESKQKSVINIGGIVGGIFGGLLFILLVCGLLFYFLRIKPKKVKYSELKKNERRPTPIGINEKENSSKNQSRSSSPKRKKNSTPTFDDTYIPDIDANTSYL